MTRDIPTIRAVFAICAFCLVMAALTACETVDRAESFTADRVVNVTNTSCYAGSRGLTIYDAANEKLLLGESGHCATPPVCGGEPVDFTCNEKPWRIAPVAVE